MSFSWNHRNHRKKAELAITLPFLQLYFIPEPFQNNLKIQTKTVHHPLARRYQLKEKAWNRVMIPQLYFDF